MDIISVVIIIFLIFGALIGLKRGFTREIVSFLGIFAVLILSFLLKNPVSVFLYKNLPFLNFKGIFKDMTVLNILMYEVLAFVIVFSVLMIILKLVLMLTKIFEKLLNITIILGIPSKILGAIVGSIEALIYTFIILYFLNLPFFNIKEINNSTLGNVILTKTPILTKICNNTLEVINEINDLKNEYNNTNDVNEFNCKALSIMIEKSVITKENAQELIQLGKIKNIKLDECQ